MDLDRVQTRIQIQQCDPTLGGGLTFACWLPRALITTIGQVLWTNYYSNQFVLFVALAVLQSHRDVLLRYLTEFDEVLKYANDLSGTVSRVFLFSSKESFGS